MKYLLGIDVSTTASKALIIDENGSVTAAQSTPHKISSPHPLWSEQNPEDWWAAAVKSIHSVLSQSGLDPSHIAGIGLTGQMHGLVVLGDDSRVLRPAILWNDQRASNECEFIRNTIGLERLISRTGNDAFAGFTAPKLLWVKNNEPDVYAKVRHVLLPKDYIRFKLTGEFATDKSGAGGTLLLDLQTRDWASDVLAELDINPEWLPPTFEGPSITSAVSSVASAATGLMEGTQIVGGGGDQAAQAVGVGAVQPDIWGMTIGTSGVVFAPCDSPLTEARGRVHAFPHAMPEMWHMMGVMLSAAGSLAWYHDLFAPQTDFDDLLVEADRVDPGSDGALFQPYLTGERTPHGDPYLRASFAGLTSRHSRKHLTRAVLEGVAFGLRDNYRL
ncbi:MAG: xylulokinase, partial [Rhodothermales bacterium]|nr:xylulokinase [Rhodothermales bacterium]